MSGTDGVTGHRDSPSRDLFEGRSFFVASNPPRDQLRALERAIEGRGGSVHPFLNAVTDVLVIGPVTGNDSEALCAREQIRRGEFYRQRWGHLEIITEKELRAALERNDAGQVQETRARSNP